MILSMNVVAAISGAAAINLLCTPPQYAFANESDVHIEQTNSTVKIGNNALSRAFSIEKGKLKTVKIVNNLAHTELIPGESSEEFVIHKLVPFKRNEPPKALTVAGTPKNWSIEGTSVQTNDGTGYKALLDGNNNTYWHSRYSDSGNGTKNQLPILLTIDRGKNDANVPFKSIGYAGRPGKESSNGNIKEFDVYVSNAKTSLFDSKNKVSTHVVNYTDAYKNGICKPIYFSLPKEQKGQFVGFKIRATHGGPFASGSLVNLYKEAFSSVPKPNNQTLAASSVDLEGAPIVSDTSATINGLRKTGKMITFKFKPVAFGNGKLSIVQKVVMYNGDSIIRKFLELSSTDKTVRFSYIDNEHFNVQHAKHTWTIPTNKGGIVEMDMEKAILGQPVYTDGLFMGSEFPEADTQIQDNVSHIRYWSGKNFEDFKRDNQLTDDNKFVTWQSVIGATHSDGSNMNVIQSDFFSYIRSIAKPSEFRLQYNSWFDNMMRISDTNIIKSFKDIDKNFSNTGVRPLDSYVVDDGWNNYRQYTNQYQGSMDVERNGQGTNKSGFWEFNSKFPSKLAPSSALVHKLRILVFG